MYTMGLDIGSTTSKGVIIKDGEEIVASVLVPVGTGTSGPLKLIKELKEKSNLTEKDIEKTVVTGYGRIQYKDADKQISELSCHAKGVAFLIPGARTIIDIGGQDAKAMKLNNKGKLINFIMNDKCAAGTGRFLDVMAGVLETDVSKLGEISEKSTKEVSISSTCTVFAESEVISHLSANAKKEDIVAGIHTSVVRRVSTLAMRVGIEDQVVMVGGVARNKGIVKAMEKELGHDIKVPELAQLTGALGAAIYAFEETK
ncbi:MULTISPECIES: 2-hydroxyisocaproyl-CoA dehydratase activator HadI [Clostridium]|jgi:predicted CoA-substrate-specific enzyme activase|uniref:2-hydroxyglutaryl-CoA dehydratase n=1 Tax=Clostridium sporogenes TaxID=1509 RepID=A0ABD6RS59_CLOSG|nr:MULTISPECIES: 2-hydroxyisocaproyl-CoA dehydratase activator HadI [Clostridium]EHN14684.1 2-hydroxyglutaryl-CoA dehydratase subunit A [Clostridium sporogenes PA 3679]EKS4342515.1 2-hydroxyglutaryl-CoA dehydratase [Clostridium botulinum]EKS4395629.1 2-hydroxyglutaryl-CoA dehydratase [Clostridium botulinum]MBO0524785.1 2-hydroxyglutaryl-CoA dehydratase [Clostridium botulinum]MBO0527131.1 2-hydroxyglutaryl-CoA dehydratase [Clostridium botulinum]